MSDVPHDHLIQLGDLLAQQQDARPPRRFPTVKALIDHKITDDPLVATVARLLWKKDWAYAAVRGNDPDSNILALLPATHNWAFRCHQYPASPEVRREALNELLNYHGVEPIYYSRIEGRGDNREVVSTGSLAARYLNAGDPYVATLIFPTHSGTPYIGCWGDHSEVNK